MKSNEKQTLITSIIDLAFKGHIEQAQQLMTFKVTELEILENLTDNKINENIFSFLQTFKEPNWNIISNKISGEIVLDFFHYANKKNIDVFKSDSQNISIFKKLFTKATDEEKENIVQIVDYKNLVKAALTENIKLENLYIYEVSTDDGLSSNMMFSNTNKLKF